MFLGLMVNLSVSHGTWDWGVLGQLACWWAGPGADTKQPGRGFSYGTCQYQCPRDRWYSSVQLLSHVQLFATPWTAACQASLSPTPGIHPNPCPPSRWYHPTISSFIVPFSSCRQSFPASGSFQMSQLFTSGGQSIGVSASTSVLPLNTQEWFPPGWTGWISLQSKGLWRIFSNTTVQKHQFFGAQLSL